MRSEVIWLVKILSSSSEWGPAFVCVWWDDWSCGIDMCGDLSWSDVYGCVRYVSWWPYTIDAC